MVAAEATAAVAVAVIVVVVNVVVEVVDGFTMSSQSCRLGDGGGGVAAVQRWPGTTVQVDAGSLAYLSLQLITIDRWIIFSHLHSGESSSSSGGDGVKTATTSETAAVAEAVVVVVATAAAVVVVVVVVVVEEKQ